MEQRHRLTRIRLLLITALLVTFSMSQVHRFVTVPVQQKVSVGDRLAFNLSLPRVALEKLSVNVTANQHTDTYTYQWFSELPVATAPGKVQLEFKLFGLIPVKRMEVDVIPKMKLVPGGHSIGVLLNAHGVMVVGYSPLINEQGKRLYPAKDAGINIGDVIMTVNNQPIDNDGQLAKFVQQAGKTAKPLNLSIKRHGETRKIQLLPSYCDRSNSYRIGLYIRDGAAGVGTLTFYDPVTKMYGALGHIIADADTGQEIDIDKGKLVSAPIHGIQKGRKGSPGEKIGMFNDQTKLAGNISHNTPVGIFGKLSDPLENPYYKPLPVGTLDQIKLGKAKILTVLNGSKLEEFEIEISKILPFQRPDGKSFIVRVTDQRLLSKTGGIIQGMSGSPIIQNGKIIGAVTHVFVNDPTRGYGVPIERMMSEAGIIQQHAKHNVTKHAS